MTDTNATPNAGTDTPTIADLVGPIIEDRSEPINEAMLLLANQLKEKWEAIAQDEEFFQRDTWMDEFAPVFHMVLAMHELKMQLVKTAQHVHTGALNGLLEGLNSHREALAALMGEVSALQMEMAEVQQALGARSH